MRTGRTPGTGITRLINDSVGDLDVVFIGDAATRTVRAYEAGGRDFAMASSRPESLVADGEIWRVEAGPNGERLAPARPHRLLIRLERIQGRSATLWKLRQSRLSAAHYGFGASFSPQSYA